MKKTLGKQIIAELAGRGKLGMFFDFAGYRALRKVDSVDSLHAFLHSRGFKLANVSTDPATIVDNLEYAFDVKELRNPWFWSLRDPTGCLGLLLVPIWLLTRIIRWLFA